MLRTDADFGVVIPAVPHHLHWARGACASVRYFMEDTPICLLLDGDADTADLERAYDVRVIRPGDIPHDELRDLSFGSTRTKMAALWAAPFTTYVCIDPDAVVWGDMRLHADFDRFDFIADAPIGDPRIARESVMDVEAVHARYPHFGARQHLGRFFNSGVHFARRGALDLDCYLDLARFGQANPGAFYGDQGPLNFMVLSAAAEQQIRLDQRELQVLTGGTRREEVAARFSFVEGRPREIGDPIVLHWVGTPKPRVREGSRDYFEPMTFFRLEFRRASRGHAPRLRDELCLRWEDMSCADWRGSNLRGRLGRLRRRAGQRWVRSKVALRARTPDWLVATLRRGGATS